MPETESESSVKGFYKYDTQRLVGFTPEHLSVLERIILSYRKKPPLAQLMEFYPDLEQHLNDTNPHNLQMSEFLQDFLDQLYSKYQQLGYNGSVTEMLESIIKNITIADSSRIFHTASRYEGINVVGWKALMDAHNQKQYAHEELFETFKIHGDMFFMEPVWMFTYLFSEFYDSYKEDGYTLDTWNPKEGSLFFECLLRDFSEKTILFEIKSISCTIYVYIDTVDDQPYLHISQDDTILVSIPFVTAVRPFIERMVISYDADAQQLLWRTTLLSGECHVSFPTGVTLFLRTPLQEICTNEVAVLRAIYYYSEKMSLDNMPVLL